MGRHPVTVVNATTVREALEALDALPEATIVQGGTDLMVEVNFGRRSPTNVVSLQKVAALRDWHRNADGTVFVGAGLPYSAMETGELAAIFPALAEAARTVGSPQIRAAGTLGGNLGTSSPAGDGLPVLSALEATVHVESLSGARHIKFNDFMTGVKRNALRHGEIITGVTLPIVNGYQGYSKVGVRNAMVISIASSCLVHDEEGHNVRLSLGAVAPTVIRCTEAETMANNRLAMGATMSGTVIAEVSLLASGAASPITDHRSTAEYRRHAIRVLTRRLMERAFDVNT